MALKRFKQHIKKRESHKIPRGFVRNDDGTVSISHNTSNAARRKKKKVNESLLKRVFGKKSPDHEKTFDEHAAGHNKDPEKTHDHLTKHTSFNKMNDHEKHSIAHYKSAESREVNDNLIQGHKHGLTMHHVYSYSRAREYEKNKPPHKDSEHRDVPHHIHHTIMKHATPVKGKLTLYHGTSHDFGAAAKGSKEGIVHSPAHLSTSHDHHVSKAFASHSDDSSGRHVLAIHMKKHNKALHVDGKGHKHATEDGDNHRGEKETIIPAGTKLKHIKSHKTKDDYHIHHFEVHSQE